VQAMIGPNDFVVTLFDSSNSQFTVLLHIGTAIPG
jgi:hypothetical protein